VAIAALPACVMERSDLMLDVGDKAPDFLMLSDSGKDTALKDFRSRNLVLYFFPKADTPG
jgi:peroxiredoxin Q/BCP